MRNPTMTDFKTEPQNTKKKWFDKPFGGLTVLSKVEGLTVLSKVEGLTALSKAERRRCLRSLLSFDLEALDN